MTKTPSPAPARASGPWHTTQHQPARAFGPCNTTQHQPGPLARAFGACASNSLRYQYLYHNSLSHTPLSSSVIIFVSVSVRFGSCRVLAGIYMSRIYPIQALNCRSVDDPRSSVRRSRDPSLQPLHPDPEFRRLRNFADFAELWTLMTSASLQVSTDVIT